MSSVTPVHPAKAIGWNEMPFGRDTRVVPSNTVLDRGPSHQFPNGKGDLGQNPQFSATPPISKLLWPVLFEVSPCQVGSAKVTFGELLTFYRGDAS